MVDKYRPDRMKNKADLEIDFDTSGPVQGSRKIDAKNTRKI